MKKFTAVLLLLISFQTFAERIITRELNSFETDLAIMLAQKYEVPVERNSECSLVKFDVFSRVKGFNSAVWKLAYGGQFYALENSEILGVMELMDRLSVPVKVIGGTTVETKVTILGTACNMLPNHWTATYEFNR